MRLRLTAAAFTAALATAALAPAAHAADKVTLQLKWVTQAQFAGYYVAKDKGFYEEEGLDVTIKPGGPDINPSQVIAALVAEYFGGPADGIGTAIATYAKSGRAALAWAYVLGGIIIGLVFFLVTSLLERLATRRSPA